ncbi:unnamed protein product [Zymoseptoria tritici ST99CH_1A5]|uniref:Uncharacterized protein n=2 Tax=Zymoseptoria tritici TaxID=1047171 RepID=A0A2H1GQ74_ZYMTR|nr:unnamed protein product [Zymoseptoria tritici ST99CH_1E4]SMY26535.1 unnamed protein product [Zymoseptoria tritici ST99CH_1A5]
MSKSADTGQSSAPPAEDGALLSHDSSMPTAITPIGASQQVIPDELVIQMIELGTPSSLNIDLTAFKASTTTNAPQIAATNIADWRATRALLRLTPQIALLTGASTGRYFQSTLNITLTNSTFLPAQRTLVPDSILHRFPVLNFSIPLSLLSPSGDRILSTLTLVFISDGIDWWAIRQRQPWSHLIAPASAAEEQVMELINTYIAFHLQTEVLNGLIDGEQLHWCRQEVDVMLRVLDRQYFVEYWLPAGWRLEGLDEGIRQHESYRAQGQRREDFRSVCGLLLVLVVVNLLHLICFGPEEWWVVFP